MDANKILEEVTNRLQVLQQRLVKNRVLNAELDGNFSVCLQNNLNYLQQYSPDLYSKLINSKIIDKKVVCFENGEANLLDLKTATLLYNESPVEETKQQVERWLEGNNVYIKSTSTMQKDNFCQLHFYMQNSLNDEIDNFIKEYANETKFTDHEISQELPSLVINGGGLGYPLLELCSKIEPKFIYYIEPDIEIFLCSLGVIDWASILNYFKTNNQYIFFIIGHDGTQSYEIYLKKIQQSYSFLQSYQLFFTHYQSKNTDLFLNHVKNSLSLDLNSNGMFDDAIFGLNNIIQNTKTYQYLKMNHTDRFKDLPVAIIANGPSLDDDLEYIKKHQNCFIIVACGTAVTALDKSGIIPDFYVAVERDTGVYESLKYVTNHQIFQQTINISLNVVHPLTLSKFKHNIIVNKESESIARFFKNYSSKLNQLENLMSCTNTNPLVSNCAVSIFLALKFNRYFLFGIDNGVVHTDKVHSCKSYYFTNREEVCEDETMKTFSSNKVKGNFETNIYTNSLFNNCRYNMEAEIEKYQNTEIYNCSNGAFIKGTIPIHSSDLCITEDITDKKCEYKRHLLTEGSKNVNLNDMIIEHFYDKNRFNTVINEIIKIWNIDNNVNKLDIIDKMKMTIDKLASPEFEIENSLLSGSLKICFSLIIIAIYTFKDPNINTVLTNKCISHLLDFLQLSKTVYKNAEKMIMGKHIDYEPESVYKDWKKRQIK